MKINATEIKKIQPPEEDQGYALYWDDELRGFGIRVTPTGKVSFIAQTRVNGKNQRITIGRYGNLAADEARKKARIKLGEMASGIDQVAEKRRAEALSVTLGEVVEDYLANRRRKDGKPLKERTKSDIRYHMEKTFADWKKRPIVAINREMIKGRYSKRAKASPAQSNQAMRVLGAIINYAAASYRTPDGARIIADNPVDVLRESQMIRSVEPRKDHVPFEQLGAWWSVVQAMRQDPALTKASRSAADLVALLTLTGLRLGEGRAIKWADVNLDEGSLSLTDTKNRDSVILPLSDLAVQILKARHNGGEYVFPARSGKGHLLRIETHLAKIEKQTGIKVSAHDLRRTFIQVGFKVLKIELWRVKMLANHKVPANDITLSNYGDMADRRPLRDDTNRIADHLEDQRRIHESDNVVSMERRA